jgi:hypothetical protein
MGRQHRALGEELYYREVVADKNVFGCNAAAVV